MSLAVHCRLSGLTTCGLKTGKGGDHPTYAPVEYGTLIFCVETQVSQSQRSDIRCPRSQVGCVAQW